MGNAQAGPPSTWLLDARLLLIAGPTATGKSEIALRLADRIGGEIVSVDSMQVYRGLDIGTAKPTTAERKSIPHHLIDIVELTEWFDAAKFVVLAQRAVQETRARGRVPILCGGTGLYFKAFLSGLGAAPPADAALRRELQAAPLEILLAELREHDPATFASIDQKNPRRVIRALEVIRLTGRPFSVQRAEWDVPRERSRSNHFFGINRPTAELHARINERVDAMFRGGLIDEVRGLLPLGLAQNPTALQAIGYRQVVEHLRGTRSLAETIELVKIRTRQFAKRQLAWFRKYTALEWMELSGPGAIAQAAERIERAFESRA